MKYPFKVGDRVRRGESVGTVTGIMATPTLKVGHWVSVLWDGDSSFRDYPAAELELA